MSEPIVAQKSPIVQKVEPGEYWWCACGRSKSQPFCDGSHKGTGLGPTKAEITEAKPSPGAPANTPGPCLSATGPTRRFERKLSLLLAHAAETVRVHRQADIRKTRFVAIANPR